MPRDKICPPDHGHGKSITCYRSHQCGCGGCRTANSDAARRQRRRDAYGTARPTVDAGPTREIVMRLNKTASLERIAAAAGLTEFTIQRISTGKRRTVAQATRDRIANIDLDAVERKPRALVDSLGTQRRIQALACLGWSTRAIGERMGTDYQAVVQILGRDKCQHVTVVKIREIYADLWDKQAPTSNKYERMSASKTKARARRLGYLPPMAWDDIDTDPAPPTPEVDKTQTQIERVNDLRRIGLSPDLVASELGIQVDTLKAIASRADDTAAISWLRNAA